MIPRTKHLTEQDVFYQFIYMYASIKTKETFYHPTQTKNSCFDTGGRFSNF